jgi:tetratricopeptide (TPR) repeat protein
MASYRRALEIREQLARMNRDVTEFQSELAESHTCIGTLLYRTGSRNEALDLYRRALEIRERLTRDNPAVTQFLRDLAGDHTNLGNVLGDLGTWSEALTEHGRAIEIIEPLAREYPSVPAYQSSLGASLNNMARIEMRQRHWQEAKQRLEQALKYQHAALASTPHHPRYRQFLRNHLQNLTIVYRALDQPAEAARAAREWGALMQGNPNELYDVACALALCVPLTQGQQKESLAALAVQALREAIVAGWRNARHTSVDPDLNPLRDYDDFRRLLAELFDREFPVDPFAPAR